MLIVVVKGYVCSDSSMLVTVVVGIKVVAVVVLVVVVINSIPISI